ncbi:MAG: class I SAM-dependent RNA methyltransferase [Clostridia bacterium]|nr:class I SAM-dependent RNA methyltransferase [Clostridia bacterium]
MAVNRLQLCVPTFFGTEAIVAHEIRSLGYETSEVTDGKVTFEGDFEAIALANVNLRCGERVLIKMGQFTAKTFDELFEGVRAIAWEDFIQADCAFPVKGNSLKSVLSSVPACTSIVKGAIVKRLSQKYGIEHFEETGPMMRVQFSLMRDTVTIYLDTTGEPLYKRGYREKGVMAPLRETLAFSMVDITRWRGDRPFCDPFCGSGTIPIEAALYAKKIAPGLRRTFVSEKWRIIGKELYTDIREEAVSNIDNSIETRIFASDIDPSAVALARLNAKKAGVDKFISFSVCDAAKAPLFEEKGVIVCNPPYGERLMDRTSCEALYRKIGRHFSNFSNAGKYILTSHDGFEEHYGRSADKKRKLYNGMLKCYLYQYFK